MSSITLQTLRTLLDAPGAPCVSFFVAVGPPSDGPLLASRTLAEQLREVGRELDLRVDQEPWLRALTARAERPAAWGHGERGFAAFVSPEHETSLDLAFPVASGHHVGTQFRLAPLLAGLDRNERFVLIELHEGEVKVFRGSGDQIEPWAIGGLPASLDADVAFEDRERFVTTHPGRRNGTGAVVPSFHGQGDRGDQHESEVAHYLRTIDRAVSDALNGQPLSAVVVTGTERIINRFRSQSRLANVLTVPHAAPRPTDRGRLDAVEAALAHRGHLSRHRLVERLRDSVGTGLATLDPQTIAAAAVGQVDTLLVAADRLADRVADPLVDIEAVLRLTLRGSGDVVVVPPDELPDAAPVGALFRY